MGETLDEQQQVLRYELLDRICYNACEGNEFQTLRAVRERNALGMPGVLKDELEEWKYDLIRQMALLAQSLRKIGVSELTLDEVQAEFSGRIYLALDQSDCRLISEEMAIRFCRLNSMKKLQSYSSLVQKVLQEVDRDLNQPLTLQHFADRLNVNSSYLSSLFSREMGVTLTEYVAEKRISFAADLLRTTQYPVKTIAKKTGFQDVQYFSRVFKKKMNVTPSQYRSYHAKLPFDT